MCSPPFVIGEPRGEVTLSYWILPVGSSPMSCHNNVYNCIVKTTTTILVVSSWIIVMISSDFEIKRNLTNTACPMQCTTDFIVLCCVVIIWWIPTANCTVKTTTTILVVSSRIIELFCGNFEITQRFLKCTTYPRQHFVLRCCVVVIWWNPNAQWIRDYRLPIYLRATPTAQGQSWRISIWWAFTKTQ